MAKDHNNRRPKNYENTLVTKNVDKVQISSDSKYAELFEAIKAAVIGIGKDLYGGPNDKKNIYTVDLTMDRIKDVLDDMNLSDASTTISDKIDKIEDEVDIQLDDVKNLILQFKDQEKAKYDSLKSQLKDLFDRNEQKNQAADSKSQTKDQDQSAKQTPESANTEAKNEASQYESASSDILKEVSKVVQCVATMQNFVNSKFISMNAFLVHKFSQVLSNQSDMLQYVKDFQVNDIDKFKGVEKSVGDIGSASALSQESKPASAAVDQDIKTLCNNINENVLALQEQSAIFENAVNASFDKVFENFSIASEVSTIVADTVINISIFQQNFAEYFQDLFFTTTAVIIGQIDDVYTNTRNIISMVSRGGVNDRAYSSELARKYQKTLEKALGKNNELVFGKLHRSEKHLIRQSQINEEQLNNSFKKNITKQTKSIKKAIASISITAIIEGVFKIVSLVFGPIGFVISSMFKMVSFIFKPLKWLISLITNPIGFLIFVAGVVLPLYIKFKDKIDEVIKKVKDFYTKKIEPIVSKVSSILGDSNVPLIERLKNAAYTAGTELWNVLFPKGFGMFFEELFKDTILPFFESTVIPFLKNNWQVILSSLVIAWLIGNPITAVLASIRVLQASLSLVNTTVGTVKSAVGFVKGHGGVTGLLTKLGSTLLGLGPWGWAAIGVTAIAGGALWYFYNKHEEELAAIGKNHEKKFIAITQHQDEVKETLDRVNSNIDKTFNKFGEVLKSQGILKPEDQQPELYDYINDAGEKVKADRASIKRLIEKHQQQSESTKATLSKIDEYVKEGKFENFDYNDGKWNLLGNLTARIRGYFAQTRAFINSYVSDTSNFAGDEGIIARHKQALTIISRAEKFVYSSLDNYLKEVTHRISKGSDDEWRDDLKKLMLFTKGRMSEAIRILVTRKDGKAIFGQDADELTRKVMSDMQAEVHRAANSRNKDVVQRLFDESKGNVYHSTIGEKYEKNIKKAVATVSKHLKELKLAQDETKFGEDFRKRMTELAEVAAKSAMTQNGGKALSEKELSELSDKATLQMYEELKNKLQKNPKGEDAVALKLIISQIEERSTAIQSVNAGIKQLEDDMRKQGFDMTQLSNKDRQSIQNAFSTMFKTTALKDGKVDLQDVNNKQKMLEEVKAQLEKSGSKDDKKHKELLAAMAKLLNAQQQLEKKVDEKEPAQNTTNINTFGNNNQNDAMAAVASSKLYGGK